ncbi:unnamed protein product [Spirodela intermedia]|uniref:Uncharacterized protein n=1 Tax=Spirodela intermedia TaxID=51605 RepID=A0ABN7E8D6_SPIIN|nr:unnamed protein product [Spirodela intermedia]
MRDQIKICFARVICMRQQHNYTLSTEETIY